VTGPAPADTAAWSLGANEGKVLARLQAWQSANVPGRLWRGDPTLWPTAPAEEVGERLGWLELPRVMRDRIPGIVAFSDEIRAEGFQHVVVLGMGGSSLAPDVLAAIFGRREGYPELLVLDSTHPRAISSLAGRVDLARALFLVSSKSGTTVEPLDFHRYFWEMLRSSGAEPGRHFAAITDPGTPLQKLAEAQGFRQTFLAIPTEGGRYSALSDFGLVPAAVSGIDIGALRDGAAEMASACGPGVPAPTDPALRLGAVLGELAAAGRDKVTILAAPSVAPFPSWVEQLVAESTGKMGRGIVPIVDEPRRPATEYGPDRLFVEVQVAGAEDAATTAFVGELIGAGHPLVRLRLATTQAIGPEFFRWELAVASSAMILGVDPYDQPDVELAKELARKEMAHAGRGTSAPGSPGVPVRDRGGLSREVGAWLAKVRPRDYIAIQAYLAPDRETTAALAGMRRDLLDRTRVATTCGYGPRFLHSTGQLHKGGPNTGLFLQIVDSPSPDLDVPGAGYTFGQLLRAQGLGDYRALVQKGRRVLRVDLAGDCAGGLQRLAEALCG
jgi:transaldolase / glucose-6-phosphate isomerase